MSRFLFIILFKSSFSIFSQGSEKYTSFLKQLNCIDSLTQKDHFNNGQLKEIKRFKTYKYKGETFTCMVGEHILYYKNGKLLGKAIYDDYGMFLIWKSYEDEKVKNEIKTLSIDTKAENLDEFLTSDNHFDILKEEKLFKFDKNCNYYLFKKGKLKNGDKSGEWITYNTDGSIKKVKEY